MFLKSEMFPIYASSPIPHLSLCSLLILASCPRPKKRVDRKEGKAAEAVTVAEEGEGVKSRRALSLLRARKIFSTVSLGRNGGSALRPLHLRPEE